MAIAVKKAREFVSLVPPKPKKSKGSVAEAPFSPSGPSLYIDVEVPALNKLAVGQEFTATIKARLVSSEARESESGGKRRSYTVQVDGISLDA